MRYFVAGNIWLFMALFMLLFKYHRNMSIRFTEYGASFPPVIYYGIIIVLVLFGLSMLGLSMLSKGSKN